MKNILLAEDDSFIAGMYKRKLADEGYNVLHAPDGQAAMDMLMQPNIKPDIVLLDIMMPNIDGWQVLDFMKQQPATKDIPVVMLSNLGSDEDVARAKHMGAIDYMIKAHFVPTEVIAKIRSYIQEQ